MLYSKKSRVKWLTDGDRNTSFIHGVHVRRRPQSGFNSNFIALVQGARWVEEFRPIVLDNFVCKVITKLLTDILGIDIRKTFDTICWDFILEVLKQFGFSDKFCGWIGNIFQSARMSMLINGSLEGYFHGNCGVR